MIEDAKGSGEHAKFSVKKPTGQDVVLAQRISEWTQGAGNMIPKSSDELLSSFEEGDSIVVINEQGDDMTHAGITYRYPDGSVEIGALFTDKAHRGKGAGTHAIKEIVQVATEKHPNQTIFALANEGSGPLFQRLGARQMHPSELCADVWEPCNECPRNPQKLGKCTEFACCDTPYDVTHIKK